MKMTVIVVVEGIPNPGSVIWPTKSLERIETFDISDKPHGDIVSLAERSAMAQVSRILEIPTRPQDGGPPAMPPKTYKSASE